MRKNTECCSWNTWHIALFSPKNTDTLLIPVRYVNVVHLKFYASRINSFNIQPLYFKGFHISPGLIQLIKNPGRAGGYGNLGSIDSKQNKRFLRFNIARFIILFVA